MNDGAAAPSLAAGDEDRGDLIVLAARVMDCAMSSTHPSYGLNDGRVSSR